MGLFPPVTGSTTTAENSDGPDIALTLQKGHERLDDILKAAAAVREYQRKEAVDLLTQFRHGIVNGLMAAEKTVPSTSP